MMRREQTSKKSHERSSVQFVLDEKLKRILN